MLETSNFVQGSALRSLSFVMSECSLSNIGLHNLTVVGLFITPIRQ